MYRLIAQNYGNRKSFEILVFRDFHYCTAFILLWLLVKCSFCMRLLTAFILTFLGAAPFWLNAQEKLLHYIWHRKGVEATPPGFNGNMCTIWLRWPKRKMGLRCRLIPYYKVYPLLTSWFFPVRLFACQIESRSIAVPMHHPPSFHDLKTYSRSPYHPW